MFAITRRTSSTGVTPATRAALCSCLRSSAVRRTVNRCGRPCLASRAWGFRLPAMAATLAGARSVKGVSTENRNGLAGTPSSGPAACTVCDQRREYEAALRDGVMGLAMHRELMVLREELATSADSLEARKRDRKWRAELKANLEPTTGTGNQPAQKRVQAQLRASTGQAGRPRVVALPRITKHSHRTVWEAEKRVPASNLVRDTHEALYEWGALVQGHRQHLSGHDEWAAAFVRRHSRRRWSKAAAWAELAWLTGISIRTLRSRAATATQGAG